MYYNSWSIAQSKHKQHMNIFGVDIALQRPFFIERGRFKGLHISLDSMVLSLRQNSVCQTAPTYRSRGGRLTRRTHSPSDLTALQKRSFLVVF
jgi:hypothetical protein